METYCKAKALVQNSRFPEQRQNALKGLRLSLIDKPIVELIANISKIPYCFSLQSCYGHFLYENQGSSHNIEPLPKMGDGKEIEYRIAYIALCIENNENGRKLLKDLSDLRSIDSEYIQYGSADWFWDQQINSYIVQVETERYTTQDRCVVEYREAKRIERVRDQFIAELEMIFGQRT